MKTTKEKRAKWREDAACEVRGAALLESFVEWAKPALVGLLDDLDESEREREKLAGALKSLGILRLDHTGRRRTTAEMWGDLCSAVDAERAQQTPEAWTVDPGPDLLDITPASLRSERFSVEVHPRGGYEGQQSQMARRLAVALNNDRSLRLELAGQRAESRALRAQQHLDAGRVRVPSEPLAFPLWPAAPASSVGFTTKQVAEIRERVRAAGGRLPMVIDGKEVGVLEVPPSPLLESRAKYAVGEVASSDGDPVVCTHVGEPSANLQATGLVDALPEYQLATVEREAPARVLAVLTRR